MTDTATTTADTYDDEPDDAALEADGTLDERGPTSTAERAAWLTERRTGIGGSDIAALAGLDKWGSPWSVYHDKVGHALPDYAGEAAEWGLALEQLIAERWRRRHMPDADLIRTGLLRHPTRPWHLGTPDFAVIDGGHLAACLEIKNPGYMAWLHTWQNGSEIPPYIDCQCQWYADLMDVETVHLGVLVNGQQLETFDVRRNRNAFGLLADIAERFWNDHVLTGIPPAPDGSARARRQLDAIYPVREGAAPVELPAEARAVAADYLRWRTTEAVAAEAKAAAGQQLIEWLGEAGGTDGYVDGELVATYRAARVVDLEALAAAHPDVLAAARRDRYDIKAIRRALGPKRLAPFQHPGDSGRLNVRPT